MLFNSFEFIFVFLPLVLFFYIACLRHKKIELGLFILVFASLLFYGYWNPVYLLLILFSIVFNYLLGKVISSRTGAAAKAAMIFGVLINLMLLAYFKYANFFVSNINAVFEVGWNLEKIFLPLAISFFTFQQISYLVDVWEGKAQEYNLLHYSLFVCFFPQLIAGPIVHHREMLPQFMKRQELTDVWRNIVIGGSIFSIGLFKKTVIADGLSVYVSPVYDNLAAADQIEFFVAWSSTLAYTFQLYFDFSGYSDMAIGCARLFGIILPLNFFSPYKSFSIVDFWRRWHITLSRFLRDYLYIALGGNRKGRYRRHVNLFLTMLLGGLWHGAGWTFVVWGCLHGFYLVINHAWNSILSAFDIVLADRVFYRALCWSLTFVAVVVSWVFFRAPTVEHAWVILSAMFGQNGADIPAGVMIRLGESGMWLQDFGIGINGASGSQFIGNIAWLIPASLIAFFAPNVAQIFQKCTPVLFEKSTSFESERRAADFFSWNMTARWAAVSALLFLFGVLTLTQVSEFLYFQF